MTVINRLDLLEHCRSIFGTDVRAVEASQGTTYDPEFGLVFESVNGELRLTFSDRIVTIEASEWASINVKPLP
jgi:hypothetical protein